MKKALIAVPFLILIVGIILYFGLLRENQDKHADNINEISTQPTTGSLVSLLASTDDKFCTFTSDNGDKALSGAIYTSGERLSGEFSIPDSGTVNTIYDGEMLYIWKASELVGVTIAAGDREDLLNEYDLTEQAKVIDRDVEYVCEDWVVVDDRFEVPEQVSFTDANDYLEQVGVGAGGILQLQCEACGELANPEEVESCRSALQCE